MAALSSRRPFVGGNWKMNLNRSEGARLSRECADALGGMADAIDAVIFPSFTLLGDVRAHLTATAVGLGGQDCSPHAKGAYTGQVSAEMLIDAGATWSIIGHSERRHGLGESDELVGEKVRHALHSGLKVVLCVGETRRERESGKAHEVNSRQIRAALHGVDPSDVARVVIAYEPVWAIGTGLSASPEDAQEAHREIRREVCALYDPELGDSIRIVYGGSLNPANAGTICSLPDVDGGLVGGASLKASDFHAVCAAAAARAGA